MTQFISKIFDSVEYPTQSIYYFSISFPVIKVERKKESLEDRNLFQKSNIKLLIDRCSKMLTVRIKYNCCTSILHSESRTPLYTTEFSSFSGRQMFLDSFYYWNSKGARCCEGIVRESHTRNLYLKYTNASKNVILNFRCKVEHYINKLIRFHDGDLLLWRCHIISAIGVRTLLVRIKKEGREHISRRWTYIFFSIY